MELFRLRPVVLLLLAFSLLGAFAAQGSEAVTTVLGHQGELLTLLHGTYGELFPEGSETQSETTVLAVRRTLSSGEQSLEVVPATLDSESEEAAELVFEPESGVTYVFWQSWINSIHSRFKISAFDGGTWQDPIEVSGPAFAWRTSPAFAVTRDDYSDLQSVEGRVHRTILHILWSESGFDGTWKTLYAPLVLEDGQYIGRHPVLVLNDLLDTPESSEAASIHIAPTLRSGANENSVVAAFADETSNRLVSVELRFAAGELSILGDSVSQTIAQSSAANVDQLVGQVHGKLMSFDERLKPEILDALAANLEPYVRERFEEGEGVERIGGEARAHLVDVGFRMTDGRMHRIAAGARAHLVDVGVQADRPAEHHHHDVRSSVVQNLSIPAGVPDDPELLVSNTGGKEVLAWRAAGTVRYRESEADGTWSDVRRILLSPSLSFEKALSILAQRVEQ